ncbi:MAG: hypothetical protein IPK50_01085 [Fibrobacterota bacterium]|nr:hypothetical protein [Fibrobacterota bacterium]QQS05507.1 MAG: hypothetical protein IPK50_01085 [Fibrobacterota bacterium]
MSFHRFSWLLAAMALVLSGCYSFTGSGLPSGLRTVEIFQVVDRTRQPELADRATQEIVAEYRRNGALRPVDRDGQSRLDVWIANYSHTPQTYDLSGNVSRFRVIVALETKFVDLRDESVLYESKQIGGAYDYDPLKETESDAKVKALQESIRKLVANTVSGW